MIRRSRLAIAAAGMIAYNALRFWETGGKLPEYTPWFILGEAAVMLAVALRCWLQERSIQRARDRRSAPTHDLKHAHIG